MSIRALLLPPSSPVRRAQARGDVVRVYICTDIYLACMVSALTLHEPSSLHALSCAADTDGAKLSAPDAENIYIYVCVYIYI